MNLLKEIDYLTRLIEQHKRKQPLDQQQKPGIIINKYAVEKPQLPIESSIVDKHNGIDVKLETVSTKVHVNPNFMPQNSVIHINPKVRMKPLIHVNPQVMKSMCTANKDPTRIETKCAQTNKTDELNALQADVKRSVYVNPKLMTKLSSKVAETKLVTKLHNTTENEQTNRQRLTYETAVATCSRLKFIRETSTPKATSKKQQNSSIIILTKRKLVRVKHGSKAASASPVGLRKVKKPLNSSFKKVKVSPMKIIKASTILNTVRQSMRQDCNVVPVRNAKSTLNILNQYKIDRTLPKSIKIKRDTNRGTKISMNKKLELVTIGGIVYKSSKNQLVRRSYGLKKKKVANAKNDKFIIATNGKQLHRVKTLKESQSNGNSILPNVTSGMKFSSSTSQRLNYKTNISNKVKQRSIQILRNKMHKNNQPCLIFQKFGYCANHQKGACPKRHDKKQVSLCKKFLQGICLMDNCPLSHDVGPEKMPTCKYFLEGCCVRDACPYRHVKVSANTRICIEFLQGYCVKGHECKRRHEYLCPEFEKTGKCSKGKYCPYPHKSYISTAKERDRYSKRKPKVTVTENQSTAGGDSLSSSIENRLRYYQQTETFLEDVAQKRDNVMRKVKLMQHASRITNAECANVKGSFEQVSAENGKITKTEGQFDTEASVKSLKRPPIGVLPAYIPIN